MAKRQTEENGGLSSAVRRAIDAIRKPFLAFAEEYAAIAARREELAPRFMAAFERYTAETAGTFIEFCRIVDPSIPGDRRGYRAHRSYQAADYLRRLTARAQTGRRGVAARPTTVSIARIIGAVLPLVSDAETVWNALRSELGFTDNQVSRMRELTTTLRPLWEWERHARPSAVKVVHMDPAELEKAAPARRRRQPATPSVAAA